MSTAVIAVGDKFHIMTRRLFEEDIRRHFVGEVSAVAGALAELRGYTFIFQSGANEYRRLPELRTRVFSLGEAGYVVNKMPENVDVGALGYQIIENRLVLTDSASFRLPVNEFGPRN